MTFNEISGYEVILRNGEEKRIVADDFEHTNKGLFFYNERESVAWFNTHDIVGFRKVIEYGYLDDAETIDETAGYGEEREHESGME